MNHLEWIKRCQTEQQYECHECVRCFRERSHLFTYFNRVHVVRPGAVNNIQWQISIASFHDTSTTTLVVDNSFKYGVLQL